MRASARSIAIAAWCYAAITLGAPALSSGGDDYDWQLPPGFPSPVVPADNPMSKAKVALGCRLFFEPLLSTTGAYSCASCHRPEHAFTDGRAHALGATGSTTIRGSMTLTNAAYNPAYTWASDRVMTLEAQMEQPLFNEHPVEMGLKRGDTALISKLARDAGYVAAFGESFPDDARSISLENMIKAIAAFERTLISARSPFDNYVYDDDRGALSTVAKQGMELFFSDRAGCAHCHFGVNFSGPIRHGAAPKQPAAFANNGAHDGAGDADPGLMSVTARERDLGRFRVPTLRNIELTAPYMHDGRFATLEQVVEHYAAGGRSERNRHAQVDPAIRRLDLTAAEKAALTEFLRSLTDRQFVSRAYEGECGSAVGAMPAALSTSPSVHPQVSTQSHGRSEFPAAAAH